MPPYKVFLIIFSILLPLNFLALIVVGWNEDGAMGNSLLVTLCRIIVNILLFPIHSIESLAHKEILTGTFFFVSAVICLTGWALLGVWIFRTTKKAIYKNRSKKYARKHKNLA